MRLRSLRSGFTLMEVLVVLAILTILAVILYPVFAVAREKARATGCLSNLKQLGHAFQLYCDDYDGFSPIASDLSRGREIPAWPSALSIYIKMGEGLDAYRRLHCPAVNMAQIEYSADWGPNRPGYVPGYPDYGMSFYVTYGINYLAFAPNWSNSNCADPRLQGLHPDGQPLPAHESTIDAPADTVLFTDSGYMRDRLGSYVVDPPTAIQKSGCYFWYRGWAIMSGRYDSWNGYYGRVAFRHGGAMVVWRDGHAKLERFAKLSNTKNWAPHKANGGTF